MADSDSPSKVKVAAIQAPSILGDIDANIRSFSKQIIVAATNGAKIIVLPEACITGYASQDFHVSWCIPNRYNSHLNKARFKPLNPEEYAQFNDIKTNKILKHFTQLCKKYQIYLTVPYIEKMQNPKPNPKPNPNPLTNINNKNKDMNININNTVDNIKTSN